MNTFLDSAEFQGLLMTYKKAIQGTRRERTALEELKNGILQAVAEGTTEGPFVALRPTDAAIVIRGEGSVEAMMPKAEDDTILDGPSLAALQCMFVLSNESLQDTVNEWITQHPSYTSEEAS